MGSYIPNTPAQRQEMLAAIGVSSLRELYANVPEQMLLSTQDLKLPQGLSELEVRQKLTALAQKNRVYPDSAARRGRLSPLYSLGGQERGLPGGVRHRLHPRTRRRSARVFSSPSLNFRP